MKFRRWIFALVVFSFLVGLYCGYTDDHYTRKKYVEIRHKDGYDRAQGWLRDKTFWTDRSKVMGFESDTACLTIIDEMRNSFHQDKNWSVSCAWNILYHCGDPEQLAESLYVLSTDLIFNESIRLNFLDQAECLAESSTIKYFIYRGKAHNLFQSSDYSSPYNVKYKKLEPHIDLDLAARYMNFDH